MLDKKTDNVEVVPRSKEKEVNYSKDPYNFPIDSCSIAKNAEIISLIKPQFETKKTN